MLRRVDVGIEVHVLPEAGGFAAETSILSSIEAGLRMELGLWSRRLAECLENLFHVYLWNPFLFPQCISAHNMTATRLQGNGALRGVS